MKTPHKGLKETVLGQMKGISRIECNAEGLDVLISKISSENFREIYEKIEFALASRDIIIIQ